MSETQKQAIDTVRLGRVVDGLLTALRGPQETSGRVLVELVRKGSIWTDHAIIGAKYDTWRLYLDQLAGVGVVDAVAINGKVRYALSEPTDSFVSWLMVFAARRLGEEEPVTR